MSTVKNAVTSHFTFAEKALARAAGMAGVRAGDIVDVVPDLVFSHDNSAAIRQIFESTGAARVMHPERIAITLDHAVPAPTTRHAQNHAAIRDFVQKQRISHFYEVGRGICHQVISEERLVLPGETVLGADSHSTHLGWLGTFGAGVGRTEMAALWATGTIWLRVPEAIRITLTGIPPKGVTVKDISLSILKTIRADGALYRSVEFAGDTIHALPLEERAVLPNMMAEAGAKNVFLPPDQAIFDFLAPHLPREYAPLYPDPDARYAAEYHFDAQDLSPQVALPHSPDRVVDLADVAGKPVQQVFIGTCTNGRLADLRAAAEILRGHTVRCRLIVIPASAQVMLAATREGIIEMLLAAGAAIGTPGCGPCMGNHMGIPAPEEVTISTANRNFNGRMGTPAAPIYLASPYVAAASA
ncbi:MAG: 3-isopropylmalate dehydratase large subunit, partial [Anaerolineae bacterium]|nr:3-isopropylmalate dehydratase large subunit [Anaerolineae bacterium]